MTSAPCTYVWNTMVCIIVGMKSYSRFLQEDTITSAEKNDTPYNSPSVLYKKVLNFWIEIWIENLVDWPKKQKL